MAWFPWGGLYHPLGANCLAIELLVPLERLQRFSSEGTGPRKGLSSLRVHLVPPAQPVRKELVAFWPQAVTIRFLHPAATRRLPA
jgi:hypothetical protein